MKKFICVFLSLVLMSVSLFGCSAQQSDTENEFSLSITRDCHYDDIDDSSYRAYETLCNAIINGDETASYNTALNNDVDTMYYTGFPLNALVESITTKSDYSGVTITYKNDLQTHLSLVDEFEQKVQEILQSCGYPDVSNDELVFNVYNYFVTNFTVDDSVVTAYDCIITSTGMITSISSAFEYILLQGGVSAGHIININDILNGVLSIVSFNNQMYYFNVFAQISEAENLKYFAMNSERAGVNDSYTYTDQTELDDITDDTYSALSDSVSYEKSNNSVTVKLTDDSDFVIDL